MPVPRISGGAIFFSFSFFPQVSWTKIVLESDKFILFITKAKTIKHVEQILASVILINSKNLRLRQLNECEDKMSSFLYHMVDI